MPLYKSGVQRGKLQIEEERSGGRLSPPHFPSASTSGNTESATLQHICGIFGEITMNGIPSFVLVGHHLCFVTWLTDIKDRENINYYA